MATRKFSIEKMTEAELDELAKVFPKAVRTQTVTRKFLVYNVVAKLLECGVSVPGVRLRQPGSASAEQDTTSTEAE